MSNYPPIVPMFTVSDVRASIEWFTKLGFASRGEMAMPDGTIMHAELTKGDAVVMLGPPMGPGMAVGSAGLSLYLPVEADIDGYHNQVKAAGVKISGELTDQFWGDRTFNVAHPDGYEIMFAQPVRAVSMEEMEEFMKSGAGAPA